MRLFPILLLASVACLFQELSAQQNFNLYHLSKVPQRNLLNPALHAESKGFLGAPGANSIYFHFSNDGFNINNLLKTLEPSGQGDSQTVNINKLADVIARDNSFAMRFEQQWGFIGFSIKKHRFTAHLSDKVAFRFNYPGALFDFVINGNGGDNLGKDFDLNFGVSARHYRELGIGYSVQIKERVTLGGRVKWLQGMSIVDASPVNLNIYTNPDDYSIQLKSDIRVRTSSGLFPIIPADSSQQYAVTPEQLYALNSNRGLGLDLGASIKLGKRLEISASAIDLGYIQWNENTATISSRNPESVFTFNGIKLSSSDTTTDVEQYFRNLGDSLLQTFGLDTLRGNSFTSSLDGQFFLGTSYQLSKRTSVNALLYGDFYNRKFYPGLTLGLYWKPFRSADLHITNTMYNGLLLNPGIGYSSRIGPFQAYFTSDNFLAPILPTLSRGFNFRFGFNMVFGQPPRKKKEKKIRDPFAAL